MYVKRPNPSKSSALCQSRSVLGKGTKGVRAPPRKTEATKTSSIAPAGVTVSGFAVAEDDEDDDVDEDDDDGAAGFSVCGLFVGLLSADEVAGLSVADAGLLVDSAGFVNEVFDEEEDEDEDDEDDVFPAPAFCVVTAGGDVFVAFWVVAGA